MSGRSPTPRGTCARCKQRIEGGEARRLCQACGQIVHDLAASNIGLVWKAYNLRMRKQARSVPGEECDRAASAGFYALMKAALSYREETGMEFSTYAYEVIYNAIGSELLPTTAVYVPPGSARTLKRPQSRRAAIRARCVLSLDGLESSSSPGRAWRPFKELADDSWRGEIEELDEAERARDEVQRALKTLPERERKILESRYLEGKTLQKIAEEFGLTRERIRQIQAAAISRLRCRFGGTNERKTSKARHEAG